MPEADGAVDRSILTVLRAATQRLSDAGIESAALDARLLLVRGLGRTQTWFYANRDIQISPSELAAFDVLLTRREAREPVSHIVEMREFWSLPFRVSADVLTPRPDSETLIEAVLAKCPDRTRALRVLDLGTGSGCLLLTLLSEYPNATGTGVDTSAAALAVATKNGEKIELEARLQWVMGEWEIAFDTRFDVIISNPPYIETTAIDELEPEVRDFEPRLALDGGLDGLDAYRRILARMPGLMNPGANVFFEIGAGQEEAVMALAIQQGLQLGEMRNDLSGTPRVLSFARSQET
jgi:release factor glutamine methyltransferase